MLINCIDRLMMAPDEKGNLALEDRELGVESVINLLAEDEPLEGEVKEKEKEKEKEPEEKDELTEIEEELEPPDEEKLELVAPVRRKEILKKYPEVFKDFPYLEKAYYREQQFTELLPTIDDAKAAVEAKETLGKFELDISKGNLETAVKAVKQSGENAFNTLVDNYLPTLAKVDKDAYYHIVGNIVKTVAKSMVESGKGSGDSDLQAAAKILNHYFFNTNEILEPTNRSRAEVKNNEADEIAKERQALMTEKFENARDTLNEKVSRRIERTIEVNIDPRESMTDYVRRNAVREANESLQSMLENDKRLTTILDRLWEQAASQNFSKSSLDKIDEAYTSRAKTLLPEAIKKARNEALRGLGKRVSTDSEDEPVKRGTLPVGRTASPNSNSGRGKSDRDRAREIPKGMTTKEFLDQE